MVLHAVRSDVDPMRDVMSHYANGSHGPVMSVVFYAFGAAAIALGVPPAHGDRVARRSPGPFPVLMVLAGLSLLAAGVFEVDRPLAPKTVEETIHSNAAVAAFVMLVVAMLLFSLACRERRPVVVVAVAVARSRPRRRWRRRHAARRRVDGPAPCSGCSPAPSWRGSCSRRSTSGARRSVRHDGVMTGRLTTSLAVDSGILVAIGLAGVMVLHLVRTRPLRRSRIGSASTRWGALDR